jgi:hypothetical protein
MNKIKQKKHYTVGTVPKAPRKSYNGEKSIQTNT